jgi:hypothetical protein
MCRRTLRRLLSILVLTTVASALAIAPQVARTPSAFANVTTGGSACGILTGYVAATPFAAGQIVIGNTAYAIAPGATLSGNPSFLLGSNVCLSSVTANASGQIIGGTLSTTVTNVTNAVNVCGVVTSYTPSTILSPGFIVIGGQSFVIAPGVALTSISLVGAGVVCLTATLNVAGQLASGSFSGVTNPTNTVNICGAFGGFTPATISTPGSIVISGQIVPIAVGVVLGGSTALTANTTICLSGTTNSAGQIILGAVVPTALAPVSVCGTVTAYTLSTATTAGSITIGGQTFGIAPGVTVSGAGLLTITANPALCLQATLNGAGQISTGSLGVTLGGTPTVNVCGVVTAFTAASATAGGSITVASNTLVITAGTTFVGATQPVVGSGVCLSLVVNSSGAIVGGTVVATTTGVPLSATIVTSSASLRHLARPN